MSAGITLAHTAIDMGKHATYLPEYGPEQRGGSAKCTVVIAPQNREDVKEIAAPVDDIALELGSEKAANIVLLGILIGATGVVSRETLAQSLEEKFKDKKPGILEMNLKALDKGIEIGKQYK